MDHGDSSGGADDGAKLIITGIERAERFTFQDGDKQTGEVSERGVNLT